MVFFCFCSLCLLSYYFKQILEEKWISLMIFVNTLEYFSCVCSFAGSANICSYLSFLGSRSAIPRQTHQTMSHVRAQRSRSFPIAAGMGVLDVMAQKKTTIQ
jgi:hypothetical protein